MTELPTGTVTFLFTDLEGSTRLWEEHPDAMQGALARHDEILRDAITVHHGQIVKTTGDGVHAAFATARDALNAAVAAQAALGAETWDSTGPLRVRIGLHTCEAEYRDGDYYGTAVNRAARLMSAAHGGQILLSRATEEVARDSVSDGVGVIDLGEHRLRDLARAERVFQLQAPGLQREYPPLRSLDTFPGNLPLQVTSFIGRDDELTALAEALSASRLVTLIGVGGVGKSRLAIQLAADVVPRFPDGAWFCELAAAADPGAMVQVVAATMGVHPRPEATLEQSIVETLRPKRVLVVLDNCEHLLRDVARLASSLLQECPSAHVVATSREALGVAGEQAWPVASLALPESADLATALNNVSVRLFDDRAHAARPGFALGPSNAGDVVEICRRLDGIPLAIELAAARVAALSPSDISGLLDERFRLLTGGRRTSVERHQTLRATVDWSYSLLDSTERKVFDRLGVFAGSFDARAAQAVAAADGIEPWDALDAVTGLVAKSMIDAEEGDEGAMRYHLLETLRQYARERLDETGDPDRWRRLHAEHYASVAEETGLGLRGPDEFVWMQRLVADLDDVRAALNWSLDRDDEADVEYALRIVAALNRNVNADRSTAFADWAERAAQRVEATSPERRADVLAAAAVALAIFRGDRDGSRAFALEVLKVSPEPSYAGSAAYAILATVALNEGDLDDAMSWASKAVDEREMVGLDDFALSGRYTTATTFASLGGDSLTARSRAEAGLEVARRLGNPTQLSGMLWAVGNAFERQDPTVALRAFEESAELVRAGAHDTNFGGTLAHMARIRDESGDTAGAVNALSEAVDHFRRGGPRVELVVVIAQLSRLFARHGRAEAAAVLAGVVSAGCMASMAATDSPDRMERATAQAREQLGDAAYAEAFARGAAMSYDDVMAYARSELDAALAELEVEYG